MTDLETQLREALHQSVEDVDFDPSLWARRIESTAAPRRRRYAVAALALALAAAAALVVAVVVGGQAIRRDASPPASAPATDSATGNRALAGTWDMISADGLQVDREPPVSLSLELGESGWWRAYAGCVVTGGWFDRDSATGAVAVRRGELRQDELTTKAGCYRPEVLAAVRPGAVWRIVSGELVVTGATADGRRDAEYARFRRGEGRPLVAPSQEVRGISWVPEAIDRDGVLTRVANPQPYLIVSGSPLPGASTVIELSATYDDQGPVRCVRAWRGVDMRDTGRLVTGTGSFFAQDPPEANDAGCPKATPWAAELSGLLEATRALATRESRLWRPGPHGGPMPSLVALGDDGRVLMTLLPADVGFAARLDASPGAVVGTWTLDSSPPLSLTVARGVGDRGVGDLGVGDRLTLSWLSTCPANDVVVSLDADGMLTRDDPVPGDDACTGWKTVHDAMNGDLERAERMGVDDSGALVFLDRHGANVLHLTRTR